jgi:uncharacterized membrane protein
MVSLPLVILPSIKDHPDRVELLYKTGMKLRTLGWITLIALFATGLTNIYFRGLPLTWEFFTQNPYGRTVSLKILLFSSIILLSGAHDFMIGGKAIEEMKNSDNSRMKLVARWTGRINLVLALLAAYLGVVISRGGF